MHLATIPDEGRRGSQHQGWAWRKADQNSRRKQDAKVGRDIDNEDGTGENDITEDKEPHRTWRPRRKSER